MWLVTRSTACSRSSTTTLTSPLGALEEDGARQLCQTLGIAAAPTPAALKSPAQKSPPSYDGLVPQGVLTQMS
jgi:hypothetical protein